MKKIEPIIVYLLLLTLLIGISTALIIVIYIKNEGYCDFKLIGINIISIVIGTYIGAIAMYLEHVDEEKNK